MALYYITGTSRGIGKAIAEAILEKGKGKVVGISRNSSIEHQNYTHISLDLSDIEKVKGFTFDEDDTDKVVLINNAGTLGSIKPVGKDEDETIAHSFRLNLITPSILCNKFIKTFGGEKKEKVIINVSSGAGKYPIDGWSTYCGSKAGLDMFTDVMDVEQKVHNSENPVKVFSVAPGIVDTQMQTEIRGSDKEDFSEIERFQDYKKNGDLASPEVVAEKYLRILENLEEFNSTQLSVREIE